MPDPSKHQNSERTDSTSMIKRIQAAGQRYRPSQCSLESVGANPAIAPGQIWSTRARPQFPPNLPDDCSSDDPLWVIVADSQGPELEGHSVLTVFPILIETEMCGPDDVFLPRGVIGFEAIVAVGTAFGVLRDSLDACKGCLPSEWKKRLIHFWRYTQGIEEQRGDVQTGPQFLSERDLRFKFQEELVAKLSYLQQPLLVWAERCGVLGENEHASIFESLRAAVAEKWHSVRDWCQGVGISPTWVPVSEPVVLRTDNLKRYALIEIEASGRPNILGEAEERVPLPAPTASWRLHPARPGLAGRRFVVAVPQSEEILGHGQVQEGGARLTLIEVFATKAYEEAVIVLLEN
jgi:hypothetical protein